jgi:hypothetical protein
MSCLSPMLAILGAACTLRPMKHLVSLEIGSFRNVRPTKLEFRQGLNVVLGKNAAGKTSLLKLLSDSLDGFGMPYRQAEQDLAFEIVDDASSLRRRIVRGKLYNHLSPAAQVEKRDLDGFELRTRESATPFLATVVDGTLQIDGAADSKAVLFPLGAVVRRLSEIDPTKASTLARLAWTTAERMDEGLTYFGELITSKMTKEGPEPTIWAAWRGQPRSYAGVLDGLASKEGEDFTMAPDFLTRATHALGYDHALLRFDVEQTTKGAVVETTLHNLRLTFFSPGTRISHDTLSYGEKRLVGFFALSDASPDIMIVDELVNGLHHEWIKACLDEIGKRQAFLTSQNPLLLDYLEFESAEDVRRGFVLCERKPLVPGPGTELVWRNPTEDEAREFFIAYETGIQRVSDILITKGLW